MSVCRTGNIGISRCGVLFSLCVELTLIRDDSAISLFIHLILQKRETMGKTREIECTSMSELLFSRLFASPISQTFDFSSRLLPVLCSFFLLPRLGVLVDKAVSQKNKHRKKIWCQKYISSAWIKRATTIKFTLR